MLKTVSEEKLNQICLLQEKITQLKLELQKNFNKVNQVFHINSVGNYVENYSPQDGSITNFVDSQAVDSGKLQNLILENKVEILS